MMTWRSYSASPYGQGASSIVREDSEDRSRWHLWGETVNMAEQMATTSNQGRCQLTPQAARSLLAQAPQWQSSTRWSWSLHMWLRSRFRIRGKVQRLEDMEPVLVNYEDTYKLLQGRAVQVDISLTAC